MLQTLRNSVVFCCLLATVFGCSVEKNVNGPVEPRVRSEMEKEGWSYVETLGEPGESVLETQIDSTTGRSVGAFWVSIAGLVKAYRDKDKYPF